MRFLYQEMLRSLSVEWFVKNGVEVWSAMEGQQRFDNHVDKLMNYIRYWQASGESLKTSIRTKTRLGQFTEEGHYTGGTVPYGYRAVDKGASISATAQCWTWRSTRMRQK